MSDRTLYKQINEVGEVTNDSASLDLVDNPGEDTYINIERVMISVFKAASGGGGIVRLQDTDGEHIHTISGDGVGSVPLDFGEEGLQIGPNKGIQVITGNANGEQASASCSLSGHLTTRAY